MKIFAAGMALVATMNLASVQTAEAKGCLKGALVGGIAGHYLHHHAVLGAIAGCAVGHHIAAQNARAAAAHRGGH